MSVAKIHTYKIWCDTCTTSIEVKTLREAATDFDFNFHILPEGWASYGYYGDYDNVRHHACPQCQLPLLSNPSIFIDVK